MRILIQLKFLLGTAALIGGLACSAFAEEKLPVLQTGSEIYSNVTVTTVTATDIYFTHAKGMGNAKLKTLSPELQKRFKFDVAKSDATEKAQAEATAIYLRTAATNRVAVRKTDETREEIETPTLDENGELVAAKLYATSFRGQRPPTILVDEWLTPPPDVTNKFVLVDFWATWAGPSRVAIPHLNDLQARFKDQLVVVGLSNESVEDLSKIMTPKPLYSIGTDTQGRTMSAIQLRAIPHCLLMDPSGIVRYEGLATFLDAANLEKLITKYSK